MFQILVFDDDRKECQWVKEILENFAGEQGKKITVRTVCEEENLLEYAACNGDGLDIGFVDLGAKKEDAGINIAKQINAAAPDVLIVFLTGYLVYAADVYDTNHIYFVLKEEFEKRLPSVFAKLEAAIEARDRNKGYIHVLAKGKELIVQEEDIRYIERKGRNTQIVCSGRTIEIPEKLAELEKKLDPISFVRCHNSFIVNLKAVREISRTEIVLEDEKIIPISRNRLEKTRAQFFAWAGE